MTQDPSIPTQAVPTDPQQPSDAQFPPDPVLAMQPPVMEDTLNPQFPSPSVKERQPMVIGQSSELPPGVTSVEQLPSAEISPEVEKYIHEVEADATQLPREIVIVDDQLSASDQADVNTPVIVLPMTEDAYKQYRKAPPTTSRRWLAEFTKRIKDMFHGRVVFRHLEPTVER